METLHSDVVIVGGGPAGATCGYILAKNGKPCILIDKAQFPREKLCGGGLTPKTQKLIEHIYGKENYKYRPIRNVDLYKEDRLLCTFQLRTEMRTVERIAFDDVLLNEYKNAGGAFIQGKLSKIEERENKIYLTLQDGTRIICNKLIGADGANSVVRKYLQPGFPKGMLCLEEKCNKKTDRNVQIHFTKKIKDGYLYLFPTPNGFVAGGGYTKTRLEVIRTELREKNLSDGENIKGAMIPMFDKMDYPFRENIYLIGDAGGYVDSISGEGLYYAIKTGEIAASSILNGLDFQVQSSEIVQRVKKTQRFANKFYNRIVLNTMLFVCSKKVFHNWASKLLNRYLA